MSVSRFSRVLIPVALAVLTLPPGANAAVPPPEVASFQYSPNMEPIGASAHQPPASGQWNSDLAFWGNTAYQGTYYGFRILDITDPAKPAELINYEDCRGNQGDVIIWEDLLVRSWGSPNTSVTATCDGQMVSPGFEGLHVFNVSNPADPDLVASINIPTCGSHTASGVPDLANNRLLVYNSPSMGTPCAGFDVISIPLNDPESWDHLGVAPTGRQCHDTSVILGDALLAACAGGNGLSMMSLGGPRGGTLVAPRLLWNKDLSGQTVTIGHATSFSWDGQTVLFGHEPGGGGSAECEQADNPLLRTMFFFNAADGTEVGRWTLPRVQTAQENCTIHNFNVVPTASNRVVVQGNYQSGISVVDFTNPAQAKEIAFADPAPIPSGGDWSSYWYDGEIYEGDMTRGLITWKLNDPAVSGARTLGHLNPQTQEFTIPFTGQVTVEKCAGKAITLLGSVENDVLAGTAGVDVIAGGGGNDRISGKKGNDVVCGGTGNDTLRGGGGKDKLLGQAGKDTGKGGGGKDTFKGGPGKDKGGGFEKGKA